MRAVKASRPVNSFVAYARENHLLASQPETNSAETSCRRAFSITQQNFNGIFVRYFITTTGSVSGETSAEKRVSKSS